MNWCCRHIGSIGLLFDFIGATILFFVVIDIGLNVKRSDPIEENDRVKELRKKKVFLKIGYGLISIGFLMQLASNELKIH